MGHDLTIGTEAVDGMTPGETLFVPERLVVAPSSGIFSGLDSRGPATGDRVSRGDVIATVRSLRVSASVQSAFDGILLGFLASEGERVRRGQPLAWLRIARG